MISRHGQMFKKKNEGISCIDATLRIPMFLATVSGLTTPESTGKLNIFRRYALSFYNATMFVCTLVLLTCALIDIALKINDFSIVILNLMTTLYITHTVTKRVFAMVKKEHIIRVRKHLSLLANTPYFHHFERKCGKKVYRQFEVFLVVYTSIFVVSSTYWVSIPFLSDNKYDNVTIPVVSQVMASWYPFDYYSTPGFELSIAFQAFMLYQNSFSIVSCDATLFAFLLFLQLEIKSLSFALKGIISNKKSQANLEEQWRRKKNSFQQHPWSQNTASLATSTEKQISLPDQVREWIQTHQQLIRLSDDINSLMSTVTFIFFAIDGVTMCLLAYMATQVNDIISATSIALYLAVILGECYIFCAYGHQIRHQSEALGSAIYGCPWYRMPLDTKQKLQTVSQRCQTPKTITGGGFFVLSLDFFAAAIGSVFAYFVVLLQFPMNKKQVAEE